MSDRPKPMPVVRREANTDRLRALTDFVARFAPAIGETTDYGHDVDGAADGRVVEARDRALVAAFRSIERLATTSAGGRLAGAARRRDDG